MSVKDLVCVVTGGGRGIGRTIVEQFAAEGAKMVIATDVSDATFAEMEKANSNVRGYVLDVQNSEAIAAFTDEMVGQFGSIDVLVNNAGVTRDNLIQKMSEEDWDFVLNINLKGVFNMTKYIAPKMMEKGAGSIINMSSVVGVYGNVGQSNYAASKGGVISMTKTWAKEFARKGARVRVNAVAPGFIRTPMTDAVPQKVLDLMESNTALGRLGEPEDIANAVTFLAGDKSAFVTGQILGVDGGLKI
ncbi:3-oxoacyl-ACP reductase FabG [Spirochaeta isovalerica]|uniref:3-oxoacyl-[acyl-carrier protein] reductase n=1 Tax=Spirochaeta isovalerica TaxID=150 RepID=A0A841RGM6_9SPIO|nr:3-oxoacyl-ACP reductase FabG [Spirochaeta isovalerica]MBB6482541.1 3-oxoacyl-[acyl-carrier protein] reductase [Spirochaeta isovalerica]